MVFLQQARLIGVLIVSSSPERGSNAEGRAVCLVLASVHIGTDSGLNKAHDACMASRSRWWTKRIRSGEALLRDTHVTLEDAPVQPGINAQTPNSMPRAEDDAESRARSPEFHDRPGSGKHTADRWFYF